MFSGSETQPTNQPEHTASVRFVWQQAPKDHLLIQTIWSHSPFYKLRHFLWRKMCSSGRMHVAVVPQCKVCTLARFTIMQCERKTTHGKICKWIQNKSSVRWYNAKQLRCESSRRSKGHKCSFCTCIFSLVYTVYKGNYQARLILMLMTQQYRVLFSCYMLKAKMFGIGGGHH